MSEQAPNKAGNEVGSITVALPRKDTRYCHCRNERVSVWDCDGCPGDWIDYESYVEPPLYPAGRLASMTPEQLIAERDRQNRIHDMAVDRCEEINSPTIETAAARARMVQNELTARGLNPFADKPEPRK